VVLWPFWGTACTSGRVRRTRRLETRRGDNRQRSMCESSRSRGRPSSALPRGENPNPTADVPALGAVAGFSSPLSALQCPALLSQLFVELGVQHRHNMAIENVAVPLRPTCLSAFLDSLPIFRLRRQSGLQREYRLAEEKE
jgi:hypothetical protein